MQDICTIKPGIGVGSIRFGATMDECRDYFGKPTEEMREEFEEEEVITGILKPSSPIVAGSKNEAGNYDFSNPENEDFADNLIYNWREKIKTQYDEETAMNADLNIEIQFYQNPPKSRLITIKAGSAEETKIRGFVNFKMEVRAEKRFVELAMNSGFGLYNAVGMGFVDIVIE